MPSKLCIKCLELPFTPLFLFWVSTQKHNNRFKKTYFSDSSFVNYAKDDIQAIVPVDGGFMLAGSTQGYSAINSAGLLMRVDDAGTITASHSYRKGYTTTFNGMTKAPDGNLIVTGTTSDCNNSNCPTRILVAKLDNLGNQVWELDVLGGSNDIGKCVKPAANGHFIVGGWYNNVLDNTGYDLLVIKINSSGDTLWTRIAGTTGHEFLYDAVETPSGCVIATANQNGNILLMKLNSLGGLMWVKSYGRGAARKVIATNNGYIVAGHKSAGGAFEITDPFILKLDTNGTPQFYKTFYGADYDYLSDIQPLPNGGFILCGMTLSFAYDVTDLYLIKCAADGTVKWARAYGGYEYDEGTAVLPLADNTFLAAGYSASFNNSNGTRYGAWLLRTDTTGATLNCRDHTAAPVLTNQTVNPTNVSVIVSKKISLSHSNLLVEDYNMNVDYVCPDIDAGIDEVHDAFTIYPNPTSSVVYVNTQKPVALILFNALGQQVLQSTQPQLDCSALPNGVYVLQVQQGKHISHKKLIVEH